MHGFVGSFVSFVAGSGLLASRRRASGEQLCGAFRETGIGPAVAPLFDRFPQRFALLRREFVRRQNEVEIVDIGYNGH
jgi:hypothetical protein